MYLSHFGFIEFSVLLIFVLFYIERTIMLEETSYQQNTSKTNPGKYYIFQCIITLNITLIVNDSRS